MNSETLSWKTIINELDLLLSYYSMKRLKRKDLSLLATKLIEKIPDPRNAKEHHQLFLRKKNIISVKQSAKKNNF